MTKESKTNPFDMPKDTEKPAAPPKEEKREESNLLNLHGYFSRAANEAPDETA